MFKFSCRIMEAIDARTILYVLNEVEALEKSGIVEHLRRGGRFVSTFYTP